MPAPDAADVVRFRAGDTTLGALGPDRRACRLETRDVSEMASAQSDFRCYDCSPRAGWARGHAVWQSLSRVFSPAYRPELHYMRGPGPKWHEKHDQVAPQCKSVLKRQR